MSPLELVGWTGTALFFFRSLVQWVQSERSGASVVPSSFWSLSLVGSVCLLVYTAGRGEPVLCLGAALNGVIYLRNLLLTSVPTRTRLRGRIATAVAVTAGALLVVAGTASAPPGAAVEGPWVAVAVVGQGLWSSRFALQWWHVERHGRATLPEAFWWVSLAGNLLLLGYTLWRRDAVLIAGFALGPVTQVRNLVLLHRTDPHGASAVG